jgi:translation initiation factor 2 beta subunit (eIF-2beta)/eIF-5
MREIVARAYGLLLDGLRERKKGYHAIPQVVREDLARFCRAFESCVVPGDHDRTLLLEGRREVWLRCTQHWNLTAQELAVIYRATTVNEDQSDD